MDELERQRLLDACAEAQRRYEEGMAELKMQRFLAFREASRSAVKNAEIAEATGLSASRVSRIARGQA